jgi:hypothetical protein
MTPAKAAAVFGVTLAAGGEAELFGFADATFRHEVPAGASIIREIDRFVGRTGEVGHGTRIAGSIGATFRDHDRRGAGERGAVRVQPQRLPADRVPGPRSAEPARAGRVDGRHRPHGPAPRSGAERRLALGQLVDRAAHSGGAAIAPPAADGEGASLGHTAAASSPWSSSSAAWLARRGRCI